MSRHTSAPGAADCAAPAEAPVELALLGGFRLTVDGEPRPVSSAKARLLIARTALAPRHSVARSTLAGQLWESVPDGQARANLRQCLLQVRKALGARADALIADAEIVALDSELVATDVGQLERIAAERRDPAAALALLRGELLEGIPVREAAFDDWLSVERQRLRTIEVAVLEAAAEAALAERDFARASEATLRALSLEPLREALHRRMMRIHAARGDPALAVAQFQSCRELLRRELDTQPDADTLALLNEIRAARRAPAAPPSQAVAPPAQAAAPAADLPAWPGGDAISSELRQVAVLCALCADHDDPEEFEEGRAALAAACGAAVESLGGTRIETGELDLLLVFGLEDPHEDDADRALEAATILQSRVPSARIGVATGRALVDPGAAPEISGEVRRRAARLAAGAEPGTPAYDPTIRPRPAATDPAADRRTQSRPQPPFVGRVFERRQIEAVIAASREGHGGAVVIISGEAGIGKTRLAEECARGVEAAGGRVARAGFSAFADHPVPFARRLAGQLAANERTAAPPLQGAAGAVTANLLGRPQAPGGEALLAAMDPVRRDELVAQAIVDMLAAGPAAGTVVVVEDAHWADNGELDLIVAIAHRLDCVGAVIVVTERPREARLGPLLHGLAAGAPVVSMDLKPLTRHDAAALASAIGPDDPDFVAATIERAAGNTLFLVRLLEAGHELGEQLPPSVISLVQEQTNRLPDEQRRTLRRASILGTQFSPAVHRAVFGEASFEPLILAGFIAVQNDLLGFTHSVLHDAVYSSITRADRRAMHSKVGAWFATVDPARWAEHALLGSTEDAGMACAAAADILLPRYEFARAEHFIEAGLATSPDGDARTLLLHCRGSLRRERGDLDGALQDYQEGARCAHSHDMRVQVLVRQAWIHRLRGQYQLGDECLAEAAAVPPAELSKDSLSEIHHQLGNQAFARGNAEACLAHHTEAHRHADSPLRLSRALGGLGDAHYAAGRMRSARQYFRACVSTARENGLGLVEMANAHMEAHCAWFAEPGDEVFALLDAALDRAVDAGNVRTELIVRISCVEYLAAALSHDACAAQLEAIASIAGRIGSTRFDAEYEFARAMALEARGEPAAAARLLGEAAAAIDETSRGYIAPALFGLLAKTATDPAERQRALAAGRAELARGSVAHAELWFREFAADALLDMGEFAAAEAEADSLQAFTASEPLDWADLVVRRVTLMARAGRGRSEPGDGAAAAALAAELQARRLDAAARSVRQAFSTVAESF